MSERRVVISNSAVTRPEPIVPFPEGIRVLAIDDNAVCLQVLAFGLRKCGYEVTATTKATQALEMLRSNKDDYDIVITDVVRADMDGFKLLEIIGLEMDIPVIMTSANGDKTIQYKGLHHGARDYLVKPVTMEHLRNIWRHVLRKTVDDPTSGPLRGEVTTNTFPQEKHRDRSFNKEDEKNSQPNRGNSAQKKSRISWTPELHKKFVDAVQQLGVDEAVPKRILEAMNNPELTREHVASHLQKYRISLRKQKAIMGRKHATTTTKSIDKHPPTLDSFNKSKSHCKNEGRRIDMVSFHGNQKSRVLPPKKYGFSLQQNTVALKMESQMRPTMPIPVFSNVIQGSFIQADPHKFIAKIPPAIHPGGKMVGDYTEVSALVPSFGLGQSSTGSFSPVAGQAALSNQPFIRLDPNSCSPYAFNGFGAPYQMYGDALTQRTPVSKAEYPAPHFPNSLTGLDEGRGLLTNGVTTGSAVDMRGQIDVTNGNDQMTFMQLLLNDSEQESNDNQNSCNFP